MTAPASPLVDELAAGTVEAERPVRRRPWPDPTPEMLDDPRFEAIWRAIRRWDVNVPDVYFGYMGATGNHVRAILDALDGLTLPAADSKP